MTNDIHETVSQFEGKIAVAKRQGTQWVETSPEVMKLYNPTGLGGAEHFAYNGVLVCEYGKSEQCIKKMEENMDRILHGPAEAIRT